MGKQIWKPGNMLYPLPAVLVSAADQEGESGILTVAWTGTVCTNPAMLYISVRPERHTYPMIRKTGEFVVNLTTEKLARAADWRETSRRKDASPADCHKSPARHDRRRRESVALPPV